MEQEKCDRLSWIKKIELIEISGKCFDKKKTTMILVVNCKLGKMKITVPNLYQ